MGNFYRAIRLTFRSKTSIAAAVLCALLIGLLWGGSIGALGYLITKVCLNKGTIPSWIESQLEENREIRRQLQETVADAGESPSSGKAWQLWWLEKTENVMVYSLPGVARFTPSTPFATVVFLVVVMLITSVLRSFFTIAHNIVSAGIAQRGAFEIREDFFNKVISYEVNHFNRSGIADTMSRFTNDMNSLTSGLSIIYGKLVREPIKMVSCLLLAAYFSWQLLLLTLLFVPLAVVLIRWLARSIKRVVRHGMEEMALMYARLEETFRSIRVVKVFTREGYERTKFRRTNRAYFRKAMKIAKYESLTNPLTELCGMVMISLAILVGSYLVMSETTRIFWIPMSSVPLDKETLIAFFALLVGASDPARKLSDIFTTFQGASAAADRIYAMIDRPVPIIEVAHPKRVKRHHESIVVDHVSFRYDPQRPVLRDVSLTIGFGETVAIVGPSGCGKSTLLSLIPRFIDPNEGRVLIDGIPIAEVTFKDLRRQIGLVAQEPILFDETVYANIRYGKPDATRDDVVAASIKAFAHEFIEKDLPDGYETRVGPGGSLLSGGQRQRIALARAILKDPAVFLLDEATSQIDINSEQKIHEALHGFTGNRTTIFVTHRLSALSLAERIVVMRDGGIEAIGDHETLMRDCPYYNRLHGTIEG